MQQRLVLAWLVIGAGILVAFGGALSGDFVADDWPFIAENPYLGRWNAVPGFFSSGAWANSALEASGTQLYRPLLLAWVSVLRAAFGAEPFWFHLSSLALHALNTMLVMLLVARIVPEAHVALRALGALVFALHPAQVECVAWLSGVNDPLLALFALTAMLCYARHREECGAGAAFAALAAYALALLTKETAVVLPAVALLFDWRRAASWRALPWRLYAVMAIVTVVYLGMRAAALSGPETQATLTWSWQGTGRLLEYVLLASRYVVAPWPLPFYFEYPVSGIAGPADVVLGAGGVALAGFVAYRWPATRFGLGWATLTVLPPLGLAFSDSGGTFALRFLYLPLIGVSLAAVSLAAARPLGRKAVLAAAGLGLALLAADRHGVAGFADDGVFYARVQASDPQSASGVTGLARHHLRRGDVEAVIGVYTKGIEVLRNDSQRMPVIEALAHLYARLRRFRESMETYSLLLASPRYAAAGHFGIGNNQWALGRRVEALAAYERSLAADPTHFETLYNYAYLNEDLGRHEQATALYERLLALPGANRDAGALAHARDYLHRRSSIR
jgi:hypothetical protein